MYSEANYSEKMMEEVYENSPVVFEKDPQWLKITSEELIDLLSQRVIYNTEDLIAFDKPAGLSYSGSKSTRTQIDRVLQDVKKIVDKDCERFNLVESLDKCASGVLLFAKSNERQQKLKDLISKGKVTHRFRVIVKGIPEKPSADINIPLRKTIDGRDMRWVPLTQRTSDPISHEITRYKVINENRRAGVSLLDVFVNSSSVHQVRCHLGLGIGCPLIGEAKYNLKKKNMPVRLGEGILVPFGLGKNDSRKVPLMIHLAEVLVPLSDGSRYSVIKAEFPALFTKMEDAKMLKMGSELISKVSQVEELGQTIVGTQASIVQMDQQRAKLREAMHAMNRLPTDQPSSSKIFTAVCPDLFVQYPSDFLNKVIKDDVNKLDSLIEESRAELKQNVNKLRTLEGDKDLAELGFDLKSYQERINE